MTPRHPFLSVVIPAYNEEARLPETLAIVQDFLAGQDFTWELLVIDDGSRDRTVAAAEEAFRFPQCRVIRQLRNQGKGAAIRRGMLEARGRWRLFSDADNSTPIEEVRKLLRAAKRRDADVVIASRAARGARLEQRQPFYREMMGRTFNLIVQLVALPGIKDTQCGFKLFSARAAQAVFPHQVLDGFSFDVEVLVLARRAGFRVSEVPVRWIDNPASRVSPIADSLRMFRDVFAVRLRRLPDFERIEP